MEEQNEELEGVHYIPKDARIPIEVGSGFLQRIQKMLIFMIENRTEEEIEELRKHIENNTVPENTWMYHYQTLQTFILIVEQTAIDKKLTVLKQS